MSHTPGPWIVTEEFGAHVIRGADEERAADCGTSYKWRDYIASTWGRPHDANARLIAAAPELLEALKNLVGVAVDKGTPVSNWAIEEACDAIAKATWRKE